MDQWRLQRRSRLRDQAQPYCEPRQGTLVSAGGARANAEVPDRGRLQLPRRLENSGYHSVLRKLGTPVPCILLETGRISSRPEMRFGVQRHPLLMRHQKPCARDFR